MPMYCGVDGVKHKIASLYTGVGGVKKELAKMWSSDGGVKKLVYKKAPDFFTVTYSGFFDSKLAYLKIDGEKILSPGSIEIPFSAQKKIIVYVNKEPGVTGDVYVSFNGERQELSGNGPYSFSFIPTRNTEIEFIRRFVITTERIYTQCKITEII